MDEFYEEWQVSAGAPAEGGPCLRHFKIYSLVQFLTGTSLVGNCWIELTLRGEQLRTFQHPKMLEVLEAKLEWSEELPCPFT